MSAMGGAGAALVLVYVFGIISAILLLVKRKRMPVLGYLNGLIAIAFLCLGIVYIVSYSGTGSRFDALAGLFVFQVLVAAVFGAVSYGLLKRR